MLFYRRSSTWVSFLEREQKAINPQGALGSQSKKEICNWDPAAWRPTRHSRPIKRAKLKRIKQ